MMAVSLAVTGYGHGLIDPYGLMVYASADINLIDSLKHLTT